MSVQATLPAPRLSDDPDGLQDPGPYWIIGGTASGLSTLNDLTGETA